MALFDFFRENKINAEFYPERIRHELGSSGFANHGNSISYDKDRHNIIMGIIHSWIIDAWLMKYFDIDSIINTAEFAKINRGVLIYRKYIEKKSRSILD